MRLAVEQAVADLEKAMATAAADGPVHIERDGKDAAVLLSPEQCGALVGRAARIP